MGVLILGIAAGFAALMAALILGMPFWGAVLVYGLVGATTTLLSALARFGLSQARGPAPKAKNAGGNVVKLGNHSHPLAAPTAQDAESEPAILSQVSMRILVVDDDPLIRELLPKIAAEAGFPDVTTAASGPEAIDLLTLRDREFDCLLLDINMPEMDGIELCLQVRAMSKYRNTPIIMLTALRDMKNMDDAFRAGATDYATKPFDVLDLGTRLKAANERSDMRSGALSGLYAAGRAANEAALRHGSRQADVQIEGVPSLIEHRALLNYLNSLPRPEVAKVSVYAVKLEQDDVIEPQAPTGQHLAVLREVALAAGEVLGAGKGMMAYAGDGIFMVITRMTPAFSIDPESAINHRLARRSDEAGALGIDVTVSVGEAIQPGGTKAQRAETAFRRAAISAHDRNLFKRGQMRMRNPVRLERQA